MDAVSIINKKKAGQELTSSEIKYFFNGYLNGEIPDYQMSSLLMAICLKDMTDMEIFHLTDTFIDSGTKLDLSKIDGIKVEKHSTGGIGDKTTLVVAPVLASCGLKVAKMSGRGLGVTGGTIDKLESIPGFKTNLTLDEFIDKTNRVGFSICESSDELTPLDKKVYALRDVTGTVDSIPLIASSVMSKKIASGADKIFIDIKLGKGAFIKSHDEALRFKDIVERIGYRYKKEVRAEISDMDTPLGNSVGNSLEVLEAINVLQGKEGNNLTKLCSKIIVDILMMAKNISEEEAIKEAGEAMSSGKAYQKFLEFVKEQDGDIEQLKVSDKTIEIKSPKGGVITAIDALKIGTIANQLGAGRTKLEDEIDPTVGVYLNKLVGDEVKEGDVICTLYIGAKEEYDDPLEAFTIE